MTLDLGSIQFDVGVVLAQLRRDLKDDWFPDPRNFADVFSGDQIETVISSNFNQNAGRYSATERTLLNVPKANFTLRYGLETGLADRALYHGLVSSLVPYYDALIPWNVFNHRRAEEGQADRYLFGRAIPSWQAFTGVVASSMDEYPVLLSTDLTNFYENIQLDKLRQILLELLPEVEAPNSVKATIRAGIDVLFECLKQWCFSERAGLPQNRDASSFLANIYMLPIDRLMIERGYRYFRYMDDIKIVCRNEFEARHALKQLSLDLRQAGLSVNSGKTKICSESNPETLADALDQNPAEIHQIDAIWHTRSLRPIARSFPILQDLTLRLLRGQEVGSRSFRYCIGRLEALAQCPEFAVPPGYFAPITPLAIEALTFAPAATDQLTRYLRAVPLTANDLDQITALVRDPQRSFYTWQTYRLWLLLVQKFHFDDALMEHALNLVREGADDANRAGAVLYVGSLGQRADREVVAEHFGRAASYLGQRNALVAVQELHFRPSIEQHVRPSLRPDLEGVYRGLGREGTYVAPPEPQPITRYIDLGRDYD